MGILPVCCFFFCFFFFFFFFFAFQPACRQV